MSEVLSKESKEIVYNILLEELDVNRDQLTEDANLATDLGADSLDQVQITMAIEERFKMMISDERSEMVKTVGDVFEIVAEQLERT